MLYGWQIAMEMQQTGTHHVFGQFDLFVYGVFMVLLVGSCVLYANKRVKRSKKEV